MVEEIDRKVKSALSRLADYAPWMFAVTIVVFVVLAGLQSPPPQKVVYPPDTRTIEYWETEARLRIQIDQNLKETADLLARLSAEMDREEYDADALLARIKEKREELRSLMERLVNLRRKVAMEGGDPEDFGKAWDES